ncbi:MAG: hypothetical protein A3H42_02830 [Deltaproteobacteria bacterium RIFCSPLOWO2_02_FULL_46_8]|nr:MAG: hypothetical protein A3H42_02830 [Deltaproteobacteria bacterium RIFCSPLOWO2_02_FULL_46_8]
MRSLVIKILFLVLLVPLTVGSVSSSPDIEAKVRYISDQLRCPVCRGVPISESPSSLAQDMTTVIRQKLAEGQTEEQILNYFVEHYGEWILLKPKPHGLNLVIWILPYVLLVSGIGLLAFLVSKWTRKKHA